MPRVASARRTPPHPRLERGHEQANGPRRSTSQTFREIQPFYKRPGYNHFEVATMMAGRRDRGRPKAVFAQRGIGADQLPQASPQLLPLDQASEANRAASVEEAVGAVSPGLMQFTTDPLFKDLWLRPDLAPRDRSLVTISSLIANGQMAQFAPHLNRAMDNGLTKDEAGEVIAQAAFYAGWPNAFSAATAAGEVFKGRGL